MIEASEIGHVALHVSGVEGALSGLPGQDRCIYFRDLDGYRLQLILPT
jgi:hypothetical protein